MFICHRLPRPEIGRFRTGPPGRWGRGCMVTPGFTRGYFHFLPTGEPFLQMLKKHYIAPWDTCNLFSSSRGSKEQKRQQRK